jgi:hypothetical protein
VFTDLQRRAFGRLEARKAEAQRPAAEPKPATPDRSAFEDDARDLCDRIRKKAELVVIDVAGLPEGGLEESNLQVTDLRLTTPFAIRKAAVPVVATVKNRGSQRRTAQVTLEIDGTEPTRRPVVLDGGEEKKVEFAVVLRELGQRRLKVQLDADSIPADNERFLVVSVRERIRVLLVEGSGEAEAGLRETTHIQRILDPTNGTGAPDVTTYTTTTIDSLSFLSRPIAPSSFDLLVLCNVDRINEVAAESIKSALQYGAGVFVMLGNRCDAESYNQRLGEDGRGPLPLRLGGARGYPLEGTEYYGFQVEVQGHPVFEDLDGDIYKDIFRLTPIYKYVSARLVEPAAAAAESRETGTVRDQGATESQPSAERPPARETQVLATIQGPRAQPPARLHELRQRQAAADHHADRERPRCVEQAVGVGHRDPAGASDRAVAVRAGDRSVQRRRGRGPVHVARGAPVQRRRDPQREGGGQKVPVGEDAKALPGGRFAMPPFRRTEFAGLYTAEMQLGSSGASRVTQLHFAANVDPDEGDTSYYSPTTAKELLGGPTVLRALPEDARAAVASGSSELGPLLLHLLLLFVLGEATLARFVSQRRN